MLQPLLTNVYIELLDSKDWWFGRGGGRGRYLFRLGRHHRRRWRSVDIHRGERRRGGERRVESRAKVFVIFWYLDGQSFRVTWAACVLVVGAEAGAPAGPWALVRLYAGPVIVIVSVGLLRCERLVVLELDGACVVGGTPCRVDALLELIEKKTL